MRQMLNSPEMVRAYRAAVSGPGATATSGFTWFSLNRRHADSFAEIAKRKHFDVSLEVAEVDVSGFLLVEGNGEDISLVESRGIENISPQIIALTDRLPGIFYRNVLDVADRNTFDQAADMLAVLDPRRIKYAH